MSYVDGYVLPVATRNLAAYRRMALAAAAIWMEHGALGYHECVLEDRAPKAGRGKILTFPRLAGTRRGETVLFSWIEFRSRAHRDRVNARVMKDPRLNEMPPAMPFDPKRMAWGGFTALVDA